MLHMLARLDGELIDAVNDFAFGRYMRAITEFVQEDLSAFFFDIRKDCLYCDAPDSIKRRAYRTVLDILFHALTRYAAPILCFTAEEVWQARFADDNDSIHLKTWPLVPQMPHEPELLDKWAEVRGLREQINEAIEPLRREKTIRSSLEAAITLPQDTKMPVELAEMTEMAIVATMELGDVETIAVTKTGYHKCGRCWRLLPEVSEDGALCARCSDVLGDGAAS